jgi:2-amino-4-hydroxy-6-hydroxymethyldihydropteridine diphosphokinase
MAAPDHHHASSSVARIQPCIRAPCVLAWRRPAHAISRPTFRDRPLTIPEAKPERIAFVGLGSNVGDRLGNLREAVRRLDSVPDIRDTACSSVYETDPVGEVPDQPPFLNAAVRLRTALGPHELLDRCKQIERELGRQGDARRHGPRPIDLDLLLVEDVALSDERLVLPHPELANRRFVLAPLAELAPELTVPDGRTVAQALAALGESQRVERVGPLH